MRLRPAVGILLLGLLALPGVRAQTEREAPSVEELRARVEAAPESGADWYALGRALQEREEYEPALEAYERALALNFQRGGAWMRMAQVLAATGKTEEALANLESAAESAPVVLALLTQIGGIPELEGDPRLEEILAGAEAARYPCRARPESRQFDFWLGEWTVTNPQGQVAGENVIARDLEGCVVRESWTDAYGGRGTSVNFYDAATERWHQIWTSDNGTVTHYEGEWRDGAMRFSDTGMDGAEVSAPHRRMTFTPNPDGSVRQLIEVSEDGTTWTVGFDGLYRRTSSGD